VRRAELIGLLAAISVAAPGAVSMVRGVFWGVLLVIAAAVAAYIAAVCGGQDSMKKA
jgi:hypothetical protein